MDQCEQEFKQALPRLLPGWPSGLEGLLTPVSWDLQSQCPLHTPTL